jgi:hypothetical protein
MSADLPGAVRLAFSNFLYPLIFFDALSLRSRDSLAACMLARRFFYVLPIGDDDY